MSGLSVNGITYISVSARRVRVCTGAYCTRERGRGRFFFITQTRLHDGEGTPQRPIEKRQRLFKNFGLGMKTVENRLKKKEIVILER